MTSLSTTNLKGEGGMGERVEASQAAREGAAKWALLNGRHMQAANIRRGSCDNAPIVRAFAAFESSLNQAHTVEVNRLRDELAWYGEQARLCRLIHSEGDAGRQALDADGGKRARAAIARTTTNKEAGYRGL